MSDRESSDKESPIGTAALPRDLTEEELQRAPVLASIDALLVDGLTDAEDEAFAAALES